MQEVCDALRGVDVPVLIKNPINPDLEVWSGGIERLQKVGMKDIGMIHRGFSNYGNTEYRNAPMWHLPIEMKRRFPDMLTHLRSFAYLRQQDRFTGYCSKKYRP